MQTTYEDRPEKDTPPRVRMMLAGYGGRTPDGRPLWRLVKAANRRVRISGVMTTMPQGIVAEDATPLRIEEGDFWERRYIDAGWVLERWFPPSSFGNKLQWESALSQDNVTPMMGPFPERGGYFMLSGGGPWPQIPLLEDVRESISIWENGAHLHGTIDEESLARAMQRDIEEADAREEAKYDWFLSEVAYQRQTHLEFIKGNPALSGFRNRLVNDRGLMSHV